MAVRILRGLQEQEVSMCLPSLMWFNAFQDAKNVNLLTKPVKPCR